jgi:hypothetical protein
MITRPLQKPKRRHGCNGVEVLLTRPPLGERIATHRPETHGSAILECAPPCVINTPRLRRYCLADANSLSLNFPTG